MNESIKSVSEFAADNYANYKGALADHALMISSHQDELDGSAQISRARVNDIAFGIRGYQVDRPLEILVASDEKVARLEEKIEEVNRKMGEHVAAGAAHYKEHAAEYHDLAVDDATKAGVHINL